MRLQDNTNIISKESVKNLIHIIFGCVLLFICAQIFIPLKPIPITLQTMGVMLIALQYNKKIAVSIMVSYLTAGLIGVPVFSGFKCGLPVLFGDSGGYLFGFIPAVIAMNYLKKFWDPHTFWGSLINCTVGTVIIFICGISVLSLYIGFESAIKFGLVPFIIPGIIKAVLLALCLKATGTLKFK